MPELINRFPICALWYSVVARQLGYSDAEAKSLGLGRAVFFAWSKNGQKRGRIKAHWPKKAPASGSSAGPAAPSTGSSMPDNGSPADPVGQVQMLYFAGLDAPVVTQPNGDHFYTLGGEVFTPDQFDRQVIQKLRTALGPARCQKLLAYMKQRAAELSLAELNGPAAYRVYESLRDLVRSPDFYAGVSVD